MTTAETLAADDRHGNAIYQFVPPVPSVIRAEHKRKLAVIYVRQSSPDQVQHHTGSTESQRALAALPLAWGWPESQIRVIDDLGLSGTSSEQRVGFQQLLELMGRGEVGIVLVRELSRISRDPLDAERFLTRAITFGVLIEVNGRVYDPASRDLPELFGLRIQALLSWYENRHRVLTFQAAKEAKIRQGYAVSRPPIGYVEGVRGKWVQDSVQEVGDAVRRVFDLYLELRSTRRVALYLRQQNLPFPKRVRGELRWELIRPLGVLDVLTNINYTPDYCFGRRRLLPREEGKPPRLAQVPQSEWIICANHHDAYVTREEWDAVQRLLHGRGRGPNRRPAAGKGSGLLQGLVVCAHCGDRPLKTRHDLRLRQGGPRLGRYACIRKDAFGHTRHTISCSAAVLDRAVVREVLAALSPVGIEAALAAIAEEKEKAASIDAGHRRQLQRAEDEVAELSRQYRRVDPEHRRVKVDLEARLEEALRRRDEAERELKSRPPHPAVSLPADIVRDLLALSAKLCDLWKAPTTTNEDRKELIEAAISKVVIRASGEEAILIDIVWIGGLCETRSVLKPKGVESLITDLFKAGRSVSDILRTIRAAGIVTMDGREFTRKTLRHKLWCLGLGTKSERIRALRLIHSLLLERRSLRGILEILRSRGPRPAIGEWTREKVYWAIQSLRDKRWGGALADLASALPTPRRLPAEAIDIILKGREARRTFRAIAEELNARGCKPPRNDRFSVPQLYQLFQHLKAEFTSDGSSKLTDLSPDRAVATDPETAPARPAQRIENHSEKE